MLKDKQDKGFTLVEVMVALAMAGIMVAAIYSAFTTQRRSYTAQDLIAEMQQNSRAAQYVLISNIRMAGYDPTGGAGAGFLSADVSRFNFTADITDNAGTGVDGDGDFADANENISLGFSVANDGDADGIADDTDGDGDSDILTMVLGRNVGGGFQPFADNIEAVEFQYLDQNGAVLATPMAAGAANLANIRAVQVSILARASTPDTSFLNQNVYTPASGVPWDLNGAAAGNAANDNFRRRLLITTIQCRNIGL